MPELHHAERHVEASHATGVEPERASKLYIEPYDDTPTMRVAPGVIGCIYCTNTSFRRSRVRFQDLFELLMLRYPMRCMRCNQRQYGYLVTAAFAMPPRSHSARVARGHDTWKSWTDAENSSHPLQRPMTTSVGTHANNLQPPQRPMATSLDPLPGEANSPQRGTGTTARPADARNSANEGDRQIW